MIMPKESHLGNITLLKEGEKKIESDHFRDFGFGFFTRKKLFGR